MINTPPNPLPDTVLRELRRHNLLRSLVQRRVIAAAVSGLALSDDACNQAMQQFCQQNGIEDQEALGACLELQGISLEDLRWQVELPMRVNQHCRKEYLHKAEARFLERKNQLDRVVYSLLRVRDQFLARELFLRIDDQEANFADLAAEYAEGPERHTKGIVGPVPLTQAHPDLAERLRTTSPGVLLEPFKISEWWLIVRLESYTPAVFDDEMSAQMCSELFDQWVQEQVSQDLRSLIESPSLTA